MKIGKQLREIRMRKGLTQREIADQLGIPYQMISQYETGRRCPKIETAKRLASILDIDISVLANDNKDQFVENDLTELKELLKVAGISYRYLSKVTGIPLRTLNDKIQGITEFTVREMVAVCQAINADPGIVWRIFVKR